MRLRALEEYANVSRDTGSRILRGGNVDLDTLYKLADYFKVPLAYLMELAGRTVSKAALRPEVREIGPEDITYLPLLGHVPAGTPGVIERDHERIIALMIDEEERRALFRTVRDPKAVVVVGDSMVPDMMPGDVVILDPYRKARSGDFVVALVDGETTVKKFLRQADHAVLRASNRAYPDIMIRAEENARIQGVVVMVVPKPKPKFLVRVAPEIIP